MPSPGDSDPNPLTELRDAIGDVDRALLELLRRRMSLASEVGRIKATDGRPIEVPEVHDRVLTRARQHAEACGVSEEVMEAIFDAVVRGSVERQHRVGVALRAEGGERLLIVGGAGSMGGWLEQFATLLGHRIDIVDPAVAALPHAPGRYGSLDDIEDLDLYPTILVSVPLNRMEAALRDVLERKPAGVVIEIASIKDHLKPLLDAGEADGVRIASLHPMFGPSKSPYEPLTFVLAHRHDPAVERGYLEAWLQHPYSQLVPIPFDHHDRLMGWLLGLGHLTGVLFGCALTRSGLGSDLLTACASTTYKRQAGTALSVLLDDPDLYFDIQHLNPHRTDLYRAIREALGEIVEAVEGGRRESFRESLDKARRFLTRL